jgi:hypothetical protein
MFESCGKQIRYMGEEERKVDKSCRIDIPSAALASITTRNRVACGLNMANASIRYYSFPQGIPRQCITLSLYAQ